VISIQIPDGWENTTLSEVARLDRRTVTPDQIVSGTTYVGLEHVTSHGGIESPPAVEPGDLSSNKFSFTDKHILYGKLRPYLRKIALPDFQGVCTTEIVPILPGPNLDRRFLYYFLRQQRMIDIATERCAGANLPRLSPKVLAGFPVPLPPLDEQRRIAAILDKADAIRRKRQEAIQLTNELLRSAFLEMFGDIPAMNSLHPFGTVRSLTRMASGKSSKAVLSGRQTSIPIYGGNGINGHATQALYEEPVVVVGRVGQQCGVVHLTDGPAWVTDNAIVVQSLDPERLDPIYLAFAFQMAPIRDTVTHLDLPFINQGMLKDQLIPLPPPEEQRHFRTLRANVLAQKAQAQSAFEEADNLFNALVQTAFRGEL